MNAKHANLNADPLAQTHEVFNQARALEDYNAYDSDTALREAVQVSSVSVCTSSSHCAHIGSHAGRAR